MNTIASAFINTPFGDIRVALSAVEPTSELPHPYVWTQQGLDKFASDEARELLEHFGYLLVHMSQRVAFQNLEGSVPSKGSL